MAKLPAFGDAVVEDTKLTDYLLDLSHPRGAAKAQFLMAFGFSPERLDEAREAFLEHVRQNEVSDSQSGRFGTIFEVDGPMRSPDGRNPLVAPFG